MGIATFAGQALNDFQATAAIAPSSKFLAEAMVKPLPLARARTVIELGPGTGVMTRRLLETMPADCRLLAFEINPNFVSFLREDIIDPRLEVVHAGAEAAAAELDRRGIEGVDAVLSSLGLSMLPIELSERIFAGLIGRLNPEAVLTQYQYVQRLRVDNGRPCYFDAASLLNRYFPVVDRRMIVRNLPPAFVYECRLNLPGRLS